MVITIDGGTTNTRLVLFNDKKKVVDRIKLHIGAGDGTVALKTAVSDGIHALAKGNHISAIIASGMIGSECGLTEISHISAPITKETLAKSLVKVELDDVYPAPFYFIPGVKVIAENQAMDMMRGEETEFFGLMDAEKITCDVIGVLPGSHNKIILFSEHQIKDFYTSISGEVIAALSTQTILKKALPNGLSSKINQEYLLKGYQAAKDMGMCAALFRLRVMDNFATLNDSEKSSYFCGAIMYDDVALIKKKYTGQTILLGGSMPLKREFGILVEGELGISVTYATEKNAEYASAYSALELYLNYIL